MTSLKCPAGYILVLLQFEDPVLIKFETKICYILIVLTLVGVYKFI